MISRKNTLLFCLIAILFSGCNNDKNGLKQLKEYRITEIEQNIFIKGRIKNYDPSGFGIITFKQSTIASNQALEIPCKIDSTGNFDAIIRSNIISDISVVINGNYHEFIVTPGDSLELAYSPENDQLTCLNNSLTNTSIGILNNLTTSDFWDEISNISSKKHDSLADKYAALAKGYHSIGNRIDSLMNHSVFANSLDEQIIAEHLRQFYEHRKNRDFQFEIFESRRNGIDSCIASRDIINGLIEVNEDILNMPVLSKV